MCLSCCSEFPGYVSVTDNTTGRELYRSTTLNLTVQHPELAQSYNAYAPNGSVVVRMLCTTISLVHIAVHSQVLN